ncbi:MAG: TonB-dependent receptor [Flavobacteriales bacterium]
MHNRLMSLPTSWVFRVMLTTLLPHLLIAQNFTVSGFVEDVKSGEKLIGANIYDPVTYKGTSSNAYGFYSLTLPKGDYELRASFVGYGESSMKVSLNANITMDFKMSGVSELQEVEIVASQSKKIQEESQMSVIEIPIQTIEKIPTFLGERDVLKTLQLLPGVQSGSEGTSGLYVRGGGPDQNLMLLDGVPVYNASHLFGFFSVFNTDAINSVELIKGGFPAHYGGRLSSVVDIRMKEGNMNDFHGSGAVGIVASKLTLEGPIVKDKASFIISGRRTYIDLLARPLIKYGFKTEGVDGVAGYYFSDLNGKVNWKISSKDRIYLSSYWGDDNFYFKLQETYPYDPSHDIETKTKAGLRWGNLTTALRYNRIITSKLFANFTATYSQYRFVIGQSDETKSKPKIPGYDQDFEFEYISGINDWSGRVDFDYLPSPNHAVKFGVGDIYHTFVPGVNVFSSSFGGAAGVDTTFGADPIFAHEFFTYAEDDVKIGARLKVNFGLHYSGFVTGKSYYQSLQPRVSSRFLINENLSIKASYAQMQQYIHLLTNATIGLPTDLWVPSTSKVKPEDSRQVALGIAQTVRNKYEISVEGYYKTMDNLLEYKEGASYFSSGGNWEDQIEIGRGWSYGAEFFVQKKVGKTAGWIGYTLSWTTRQFENLNFGKPFPYRYDRRHDLSIVLTQEISKKVDFAATWVYGTGNAVTLPISRYAAPDANAFSYYSSDVYNYGDRNSYRMAAYHRLDFGFNFHKEKKRYTRTWSVGAYNAYSRKNPFYLYFQDKTVFYGNGTSENSKELIQVSLFPIVPYVTYSFKF